MTRVIRCEDCKTYLGEIRDANLRTDVKHYCSPCSDKKEPASSFTDLTNVEAFKNTDTLVNDFFSKEYMK